MLTTQIPDLYILDVPNKGRGVFCAQDIAVGSIIEICPVIIMSKSDRTLIHQTKLHDYYFIWDEDAGTIAIPLGYGCLYNHDEQANADTESDDTEAIIRIIAKESIQAGTEITISYLGGLKNDGAALWF